MECLPADKPWDVVSVARRSSGVAPRACVRVYARVLVPPNLYIHTYIHTGQGPVAGGPAIPKPRLSLLKLRLSVPQACVTS